MNVDGLVNLELCSLEGKLHIEIEHEGQTPLDIFLDNDSLYKLIGALHQIQKELMKGGENV